MRGWGWGKGKGEEQDGAKVGGCKSVWGGIGRTERGSGIGIDVMACLRSGVGLVRLYIIS